MSAIVTGVDRHGDRGDPAAPRRLEVAADPGG